MRAWRGQVAAQSPEARRQSARERHAQRMAQLNQGVTEAARLFGIEHALSKAAKMRALAGKNPAA